MKNINLMPYWKMLRLVQFRASYWPLCVSCVMALYSSFLILAEESGSAGEKQPTVQEVEPLIKDFGSRWKAAIELMHKDVITSFSNFLCGMEILKATLTQLLLYYTRLSDCVKRINGGSALNKDLVSISSILYEIKKFSRTF